MRQIIEEQQKLEVMWQEFENVLNGNLLIMEYINRLD